MKLKQILIVFLFIFLTYALNLKIFIPGDTIPAKYLPLSILHEFDFDFDEFPSLYKNKTPYYFKKIGSHYYSSYPLISGILATPVYAIGKVVGVKFTEEGLKTFEKISASLITALSALFILLALLEFVPVKTSLILVFIYAFCTSSWSSSSQELWQHSSSQLFNALAIYFFTKGIKHNKFVVYAGFFLIMGVFARPTNIIIAIIMSLYVFHRYKEYFLMFICMVILPFIFLIIYNLVCYNHVLGGYMGYESGGIWWHRPLLTNLASLLVSPSRGLLIYSPVLVVSFVGMVILWIKRDNTLLLYLSFVPVAYLFLLSNYGIWWGGGTVLGRGYLLIPCLFLS